MRYVTPWEHIGHKTFIHSRSCRYHHSRVLSKIHNTAVLRAVRYDIRMNYVSVSIKATAVTHAGSSSHLKVMFLASTSLFKSTSEPLSHVSLYKYYKNTTVDILLLLLMAHRVHRMSYWCNMYAHYYANTTYALSEGGHIHALHRLSLKVISNVMFQQFERGHRLWQILFSNILHQNLLELMLSLIHI